MLEFIKLFAAVLFLPLLPVIFCGLAVNVSEKMFLKMTKGFGRGVVIVTSMIGTPVHELGHAMMCPIFGHRIKKMCLWNPKAPNGVLGYVNHTYNRRNIWHRLGSFFISIGPVLIGLCVITVVMLICFPSTIQEYYLSALSCEAGLSGAFEMIVECIKMIPLAITDDSMPVWVKIIGCVLILSVCLHISLSPADIKNSFIGFPIYALISLGVSLIIFFVSGQSSHEAISVLSRVSFMGFALYMVVFAGIILLLMIGFLCFIIGRLFGR
ncbi:MAG: hypothetical protein E7667_01490 [Ruminococcaceae bacterium]|nr:hypothetical protein [Oscillospiraceae bacterium]